jgi:hypothetical protein
MKWFGRSWGAPVCEEGEHVTLTPTVTCARCKKVFDEFDCGLVVPSVSEEGRAVFEAYHRLCFDQWLGIADPMPRPAERKESWTPPIERPLERVRRTDDGTYPNVGEELAKLEERAKAAPTGAPEVPRRNARPLPKDEFDPDLSPTHPHNQSVAEKKGLIYDRHYGVYRDFEGCATNDKFGQKI